MIEKTPTKERIELFKRLQQEFAERIANLQKEYQDQLDKHGFTPDEIQEIYRAAFYKDEKETHE